ncbi:alpha-amylase family glycosyl hydrolase [Mariniblastus fucicola]|nr:alpha-amylase family glycosyl hydrolase [Mariniblastus fucicola]
MQHQFGHRFENGKVTFRVWAPKCKTLDLETKKEPTFRSMQRDEDGWFEITVDDVQHADAYRFCIDGERSRPDPAAHAFESSVHDWNLAVDHAQFDWRSNDWKGIEKRDLIIYELHIGTFTKEGTFLSAIERVDELVELGITAIEILPVAQCPGRWNWGYDGVGIYATQNTYGSPDDFKTFVDACHQKGVAVILDVVFNHLGPEGNYLSEFAPFFTKKRKTPWGDALNFDGKHSQPVREFMAQCGVHWIENYRLDGLRVDAVHFMFDDSDLPISMAVTKAVDDYAATVDRHIHLIGETNVRNASLTKGTSSHGTGFDAVWSDGMMHCVLSIGQPGLDLCHRDHDGATDLQLAIQQGFLYENFPYERHDRGARADLDSFVIGFQNHDTVGNHPLGHRIHQLASREFQMASAALYLMYPAIPMIFMGEEFASDDPFLFFVDFNDSWVRDGVEKGRAAEFPELNAKLDGLSPLSPKSFRQSKLRPHADGDAGMRTWYRDLIGLRKKLRREGLICQSVLNVESRIEDDLFLLHYENQSSGRLSVATRLAWPGSSDKKAAIEIDLPGEILLDSESNGVLKSNQEKSVRQINVNQTLILHDPA